ncbi:hypothetical protein EDD21DRAFT_302010 [Dissophora ornata]|nr:hypothetical protein EDD21DRAFT_302010 [Dissophora ornata]
MKTDLFLFFILSVGSSLLKNCSKLTKKHRTLQRTFCHGRHRAGCRHTTQTQWIHSILTTTCLVYRHARRYLNIYLPTAGFEISQTDRYSAVTNKSEACVIANRPFEVGLELRYCAGTIANLNEQEEKDLENRTSDFSVIKTSRRGTCLFLGPARFVNHDCEPNCSFMSAGANVIYFKVLKSINVNDEITTHYGDNYFGVNNQECLCATCERCVK